jgi:hypothetical protein
MTHSLGAGGRLQVKDEIQVKFFLADLPNLIHNLAEFSMGVWKIRDTNIAWLIERCFEVHL